MTGLVDAHVPLERIDLRVAAAICHELDTGLGDLIVFSEKSGSVLQRISKEQQRRLDELEAGVNKGALAWHATVPLAEQSQHNRCRNDPDAHLRV